MLVLTRKRSEEIIIGSDIAVTVVEIRREWVKLGITGPKSIPVHRSEIYDRIYADAIHEPVALGQLAENLARVERELADERAANERLRGEIAKLRRECEWVTRL